MSKKLTESEIKKLYCLEDVDKIPRELLYIYNCLIFYSYKINGLSGRKIAATNPDFPRYTKVNEMIKLGEACFNYLMPIITFSILPKVRDMVFNEDYEKIEKKLPKIIKNWIKFQMKVIERQEGQKNNKENKE